MMRRKYFYLSLIGHLLLLVSAFFYFRSDKSENIISSYVSASLQGAQSASSPSLRGARSATKQSINTNPEIAATSSMPRNDEILQKSKNTMPLRPTSSREARSTTTSSLGGARSATKQSTQTHQEIAARTAAAQQVRGDRRGIQQNKNSAKSSRNKTILQILHTAIAAKQTYPQAAIELKQSGTVRLGFILAPDGTLSNIEIIGSSGSLIIDNAALNAVTAASPVSAAGSYLQKSEYFTVAVIFS